MNSFATYSRFILVAVSISAADIVLGQGLQAPVKSIIQGKVVNLTEIAAHPKQNQGVAQFTPAYPEGYSSEQRTVSTAPSGQQKIISRGSSDSVAASPAPQANFAGQYFDGYRPCSPSGAVSENYVASVAEYQLVVQDRTGTILLQANPYDLWASSLSIGHIYENRLEYDPYTQRWIMACFSDEFTDSAGVLMAISQTEDPRGNWNVFKVLADRTGRTFVDFPDLGFNKTFVAITGVVYPANGTALNEGVDTSFIYVFDKNAMINNQPVTCSRLGMVGTGNSVAQTYDTTINDLYILEEWNHNVGQLELLDVTGSADSAQVSVVGYPTSLVPYDSYPTFDFAPELGTGVLLQTGIDKPNSLVYANSTLWCAQTIFLPYGNPTRCSVQWWQIDTLANILQLGLIDDSTEGFFYSFGSIAVNQNNDALIGYSVSSPNIYASGGYAYHDHNQPAGVTDSALTYIAGLSAYIDTSNGDQNYWGHLSSTVIDPYDNFGFWTIQSYAAATPSTWGAWWADVDNYITGIKNIAPSNATVTIFPNPTSNNFDLQVLNIPNSTVHIKLLNVLGQSVYEQTASAQTNIISIAVPGLAKGVYLVQVSVNEQVSIQKLVVQ